jgi:hypothetical protein
MKTCRTCGETKPEEDFYKKLGKRVASCAVCHRAARRAFYDKHYRVPTPPGGHPCAECSGPVPQRKVGGPARKFCSRTCAVAANARQTASRQRYYQLARYGITVEHYEAMREQQSDRCAICGTDDPQSRGGTWHVDHCHDSGIVRGLLCTRCNIGLGQFQDDPARLTAAVAYLTR